MVDTPLTPTQPNHIYLIHLYKEDLVLNNLRGLTCHKTKPKQDNTNNLHTAIRGAYDKFPDFFLYRHLKLW